MAIPEKISEALIQTDIKMKSFRKAMLVLLFEWQNLETRLDLTDKCFKETYPLHDSTFQSSPESTSIKSSIQTRINEFDQKERDFRSFQEVGLREMEIREDKLGFIRKEINLREKKVEEREGLIELERKSIEMRMKENRDKEEEFVKRVEEFEIKKMEFEKMKKDFEFRGKEGGFIKEKLSTPTGSAVFRIAGPSNQSMALVNVSEMSSANQQISKGRLRSKAWLHFTKIEKGKGSNDKCKCNYCHRIFTLCGGGTSQLLRHISEGRCAAYQKIHSALPLGETLSQTHSQQLHVKIKEPLRRPINVGEDTRTPLIEGYEESVKQEPATVLLEPESQSTQPHMEPHMPSSAIHNTALSDYNYQPQQSKDLSKDQSDPSFDQQPLGMGNPGMPPPLRGCSVSLASSENLITIGDSDQYCQETQLRDKGNSDIYENASGDSSEELQMFTCEVKNPCFSGDQRSQSRKREREDTIEQNESSNVFLNSDIDDLSSPVRKHCSSKLSSGDDENTEEVLHEVDPVSCIIPIDPAQEFYGHMMNQKDLTHEGSMPE